MSLIQEYLNSVRDQLEQIMAAATWTMRSEVTMIVIPVRISGNWCLYQIMRGSHTQVVLRLTEAPVMVGNQGAMAALGEIDQIVHSMARGAMRIWTRMLLRDIPSQGFDIEQVRRRAQVDAEKDDYYIMEPAHLDSNRMTAGVACMYILQVMLQTGRYHTEDLQIRYSYLSGAVEGQHSAVAHTRHMMQLALAANRLVGTTFSDEVTRRLT